MMILDRNKETIDTLNKMKKRVYFKSVISTSGDVY